jgi:hypothetical protein
MSKRSDRLPNVWRKQYALPAEHGSWIWWLGPLFIGLATGGHPDLEAILLVLAALCAFLLRQPTMILVKAVSGRRPRNDIGPASFWIAAYGLIGALATWSLIASAHSQVVLLAIPGVPVFGWHLWLISRRAERGQMGIELVGAGVLALAAPAGYWVAGGADGRIPWILWALTWLQAAASIVFVYLRLEQRKLKIMPPVRERWRQGGRTLMYHAFNMAASLGLAIMGMAPWLVPVAFALMLIDAAEGVARPPVGAKPTAIGLRQLSASVLFVVVMAVGFRFRI